MANIKRHFIAGKMNKSVDERLVPNGEYIDALNVRLGSTEASEIGSVENSKGNTRLTTIEFGGTALSPNAKCIGVYEDGTRETIYWFINDPSFTGGSITKLDLIVSLNVNADILTYHVVSERDGTTSKTTLNFNPTYLITGIDMVEDQLFFTDDYNAPRVIDITKNYPEPSGGVDQFTAEDILVIKKPPINSPTISLSTTGGEENYIEERFLCFAYRYKYEGNQYSATSQFSEPAFTPNPFFFSPESFLNEGMINSNNQVVITYDSGGPLVKGIDLLFKESNSNVIKVIQKLDKQEQGLADNTDYTFSFDSNKIFTILPDSELLRLFDNVPRFAQAQTIMGNRLIYGNYVDGYNLKDKNGNGLRLDYTSELSSLEISIEALDTSLDSYTFTVDGSILVPDSKLIIDFEGAELTAGSVLSIFFRIEHFSFSSNTPTSDSGVNPVSFTYVLPQAFATIHDLATSTDFINKIGTSILPSGNINPVYDAVNPTSCSGTTFTDNYNCNIAPVLTGAAPNPTWTKYVSGHTSAIAPPASPSSGEAFIIGSSIGSDDLELTILAMRRVNDVISPTASAFEYFSISDSTVSIASSLSELSLHSNRNYEVGIIYMDDFNRATTALVSAFNSVNIPCGSAYLQNKIKVTIPPLQLAPSFATRYKFCIKPDKQGYETIYTSFYFTNPLTSYTYFLIDGENAQKVEEGSRLIVKRDSNGYTSRCRYGTVLEKKAQEEDFFTMPNVTIPSGVYMKILANDFAAILLENAFVSPGSNTTHENNGGDWPTQIYYGLSAGTGSSATAPGTPPYGLTIPAGSTITLKTEYRLFVTSAATMTIDLEFTSPQDYSTIIEWFNDNDIEDALNNEKQLDGWGGIIPTLTRAADTNTTSSNYGLTYDASNPYNVEYVWYENLSTFEIRFVTKGFQAATQSTVRTTWEISRAGATIAFETEPSDALADVWYESSESYAIDQATGYHSGNVQPQTAVQSAIIDTAFGNCYSFGNGVESYRIRDSIKGKAFDLGERFFSTSAEDYKEADRFAALTYSGVFNTETNVNKLNEFNLGILNFKNLEESFGAIQILSGRETDILTLQEDKISYVQSGKNLLSDAAGGSAVTSVPEVLGQQIARVEEYGISQNPESFVQYGYDKFFTDAKRGAVIQLRGVGRGTRGVGQGDNLTVISELGMRSWFRDLFIGKIGTQKLGAFDPYMNEYVLSSNDTELPVTEVILNCGVTRRLTVTSANPVSFTVNVGNLVGVCDIDYNIISFSDPAGSINIKEDYTPTTTNVAATGAGVINFAKDSVADEDVIITLTPASPGGKQVVELELTVGCPQAQEITLIEVCVSKNNQALKTIHNEYQWTDGSTFTSPLHSKQVTFPVGDRFLTTPENADYTVITAPQGGGIIPNDGDTLTVRSVKNKVDTYDFVTSPTANRLMFLRSSTLYNNTPADMTLLLAAATSLTLSNPATGIFQGDVTIPTSTDMYMYIIYDYFTS